MKINEIMKIIRTDLEKDYANQIINKVEIIDREVKDDELHLIIGLTTDYGFYVFKYILDSKTLSIKHRELTHAVPI